jgi:uncharacterized protein (TIRG00374 family)
MSLPLRSVDAFRRSAPRVVISLGIAGAFAWALHRGGLPFAPPAETSGMLQWWGIPGFMVLMSLAIYFRTGRWVHMLRPASPGVSSLCVFSVSLLGGGLTFFAPLRLGEMVRPYLIADREPDVTFGQALGTVAAERTIDGLVIVLMTTISLHLSRPISPLPDHVGKLRIPISLVPAALRSASALFIFAFVCLIVLYAARQWAADFVRRRLSRVPRVAEFTARILERVAQGMAFVSSWRSTALLLRDTLIYWGCSVMAYWVLIRAVGLAPSVAQACFVLGIVGLGSMLPAGPGFFGAYQIASYTALAMYCQVADITTRGALFVFVCYVLLVLLNALSCLLGSWLLRRSAPATSSVAGV